MHRDLEKFELDILINNAMNIPYEKSLVAQNLASTYIRVFGRLLDWSSINCSGSFIFKTLFAENETLIAMLDFLSMKTKNQPFCLKDEANGGKLKTIIASSAKVSFPYIDLFFRLQLMLQGARYKRHATL